MSTIDLDHIKTIFGDVAKAISAKDFQYARDGLAQLISMLPVGEGRSTLEDYLEATVTDAEFIAKKASKAGSWQAAIAAKRLALESRKELEALTLQTTTAHDPIAEMTDEQMIEMLLGVIPNLPEPIIGLIEDAIDARHGRPALSVLNGGRHD